MLNNSMENLDTKEAFITLTALLNNDVDRGTRHNIWVYTNCYLFPKSKHNINMTSCREVNWILLWLLDYSN